MTTEHRRTASGCSRDRTRERFPQAENQRIEIERAHSGLTHGSDVTSIVDPRATVREEVFDVRLNNANGRIREMRDDRNWTSKQTSENHGEGVVNDGAGSANMAGRRLTS